NKHTEHEGDRADDWSGRTQTAPVRDTLWCWTRAPASTPAASWPQSGRARCRRTVLSAFDDDIRVGWSGQRDGVGPGGGRREVGPRHTLPPLEHAHRLGEPIDRPCRGDVVTAPDPVLKEIGSPHREDDREDQAVGHT